MSEQLSFEIKTICKNKYEILTNSFECFDHARLHTCDPVSTLCKGCPVNVFQNRIHLSAVPPPLANSPCWWGDHAIAFTAARWSVYVWTGDKLVMFHTNSLLSLPPEARCWWSGDHFSPHTSCLCPVNLLSGATDGVRISLCRISLSLLPDDSISEFQANAPEK
jgi:hypothetical protein